MLTYTCVKTKANALLVVRIPVCSIQRPAAVAGPKAMDSRMPMARGGSRIEISSTPCHQNRSCVRERAIYSETGVPTSTTITIARAVRPKETRIDSHAEVATSDSQRQFPIEAISPLRGYSSASANRPTAALRIQRAVISWAGHIRHAGKSLGQICPATIQQIAALVRDVALRSAPRHSRSAARDDMFFRSM